MNRDTLFHLLTEEQRQHFEEQGYLVVENALSEDTVASLTDAIDRLHEKVIESGKTTPNKPWGWANFLGEDDAFLDLLDCETTFPKIWGIMGWNIFLYHAHLHIKPPSLDTEPGAGWLEWHQDSARMNVEIKTRPRPRLSMKIGYFLTDISEPGRGNFYIIPGSHLSDERPQALSEVGRNPREGISNQVPDGAIPVCVKPGTAVFFDRRLWHSRSPNHSEMTRKVLFYGYAYRWIRPKDNMTVEHLYERIDPIRRQLLGAAVRNDGRFAPTDDDVPLRTWLIENLGEQAVAAMD
ncbi:MAG: phytanoyl-CoA dioxygenase family protein [Candidatus Poribacteria bacterium]|nr:phytanoyl-CoA dioxygenase family protein [Candidatus Poribacteria bacterium]